MSSLLNEWLFLGLVSFGGAGAHLGLFEENFVGRMSSRKFSEFLAMCSTLPGATSSQLATCIGVWSNGVRGGLTAFLGFAFPGFVLMTIIGLLTLNGTYYEDLFSVNDTNIVRRWIDCASLSIVSVAAVALTKKTCKSELSWYFLAFLAAAVSSMQLRSYVYPLICVGCGLLAELFGRCNLVRHRSHLLAPLLSPIATLTESSGHVSKTGSLLSLIAIIAIGVLASISSALLVDMFSAGMFVFGGGPVAIPYLHSAMVGSGLVASQDFLTSLALMYIAPGPMFNVSMFLGIVASGNLPGGLACWVCMMVPGVLLVFAVWPWWKQVRGFLDSRMPSFLDGLNAGACGLLIGAGLQMWTTAELSLMGVLVVCAGVIVEIAGRVPPYIILLGAIVLGVADLALFKLAGADVLAQRDNINI